jgi:hypothetical protein
VPRDPLFFYRQGIRPTIRQNPGKSKKQYHDGRGSRLCRNGSQGEKGLWLRKGSEVRAIGSEVTKHRSEAWLERALV